MTDEPRRGTLWFDGWSVPFGQPVEVVDESTIVGGSPDPITLAGRRRYLDPGETALVPKYAVTLGSEPRQG